MKKILLCLVAIIFMVACDEDSSDNHNGLGGFQLLRASFDEPKGENCAFGGTKSLSGLDLNFNGVLDDNEVTATTYSCNNETGTALTEKVDEPKGENCAFGGTKISSGVDLNINGVLDEDEVLTTVYACKDETGTGTVLTNHVVEPKGENCMFGGTAIL